MTDLRPAPSPPRRATPTPNYPLRRAVTGALALGLVVLLALGVRSLFGGDTSTAASPTSTVAAATATPSEPSTTAGSETTTTAGPVATEVVTFPRHNDLSDPPVFPLRQPPIRQVSASDPLTLWVLGDSTAQALGQLLENDLADDPEITTRTIYKNSTGLTRQDFYDWPAALPSVLAEGPPDAVVLSMGDNDAQALQPQGSDTFVDVGAPEWTTEYERRLTAFVGQMTDAGSHVYLVGQPPMRSETFNERIAVVDAAYRQVAADHDAVDYINSGALLADDSGQYTDRLPGPGGSVQVRNGDGIHLSLEGARWMALVVGRLVAADYGLQAP